MLQNGMPSHKLTKSFVDSQPLEPKGKQRLIWDTDLKGFGVCIGATSKSYLVQRKVHGRDVRCRIGKHGVFTVDEARQIARQMLMDMALGTDPVKERAKAKVRGRTLNDLYLQYRKDAEHRLAAGTLVGYQDFMDNQFADWLRLPIAEISKEMVVKRHQAITVNSGKGAANNALQFLRAIFNYAMIDDEALANPVLILSQKKLWHAKERRQGVIKDHQLAAWYAAVMAVPNDSIRDALCFLLFTGLRKMEAFTLQWSNVDLMARTFRIVETKNGRPLELPLSDYLYDMLLARLHLATASVWVFPGSGNAGHLVEPKKAMKQVIATSEVRFILHDLRRTFITTAERLEISSFALKRLINHKSAADVTAGYIIMDFERLRKPMQLISRSLLSAIDGTTAQRT